MKGKLVATVAALLLLLPSHPEPRVRSGAYVQDVRTTSAKICWLGWQAVAVEMSVVPEAGGDPLPVEWLRRGNHCVVRATGLAPGTRYRYVAKETVADGSAVVAELSGSFTTPPVAADARVRFGVVGDSGGLPFWINLTRSPPIHALTRSRLLWQSSEVARIGEGLAAAEPDFWVHVGDVVYPRGEQRHYWTGFFRPFADVLRHAPVYPVLGNHDWEWDHGRPFLANFELPDDADEHFFSIAWGPVRLIGLNLNHSVGIDPGIAYAARALAAAREPWRIVAQHFPLWSGSRQGDRPDLIERMLPVLTANHVDLLLCGHDHVYQRFAPQGGVVEVVTGGGGKSLYDQNPHPALVKSAQAYHFCVVDADARSLTLKAIDQHGALIDEFTLTK